jgi:hypothetical protein
MLAACKPSELKLLVQGNPDPVKQMQGKNAGGSIKDTGNLPHELTAIETKAVKAFEAAPATSGPRPAPLTKHGGGFCRLPRNFAGAPFSIPSRQQTIVAIALRCARFQAINN